jgi:hypothetical protein
MNRYPPLGEEAFCLPCRRTLFCAEDLNGHSDEITQGRERSPSLTRYLRGTVLRVAIADLAKHLKADASEAM